MTFSGLDGSGKSTLMAGLAQDLDARGCRTAKVRMQDISLYSYLRGARDAGRGAARTILRRKATPPRLGSGPLYTFARHRMTRRLAYLGDIVSLLARRIYHEGVRGEVLLLDRYLYDLLADVSGEGWPDLSTLLVLTPRPDVPIFVDVPPERAFARKGEYDLASLTRRRESYREIFARVRDPLVVENEDLEDAQTSVRNVVLARLG